MNTLTRLHHLRQLEALQQGLGTLFTRPADPWPDPREEPLAVAEWVPQVDISEDATEYLIQADLPEVRREDVRVTAEAGTLTITGDRHAAREEHGRRFHRTERSHGKFERHFSIPEDASASGVTAVFKDGVLSVHLAKTEKAKPQAIEVKAA